jgi:hypothetical protein
LKKVGPGTGQSPKNIPTGVNTMTSPTNKKWTQEQQGRKSPGKGTEESHKEQALQDGNTCAPSFPPFSLKQNEKQSSLDEDKVGVKTTTTVLSDKRLLEPATPLFKKAILEVTTKGSTLGRISVDAATRTSRASSEQKTIALEPAHVSFKKSPPSFTSPRLETNSVQQSFELPKAAGLLQRKGKCKIAPDSPLQRQQQGLEDSKMNTIKNGARRIQKPRRRNRNSMVICFVWAALVVLGVLGVTLVLRVPLDHESQQKGSVPVLQERHISNATKTIDLSTVSISPIPKVLIFTYSKDLWSESYNLDDEEVVLAANIRQSVQRHSPDTQVVFLTDDDCISSLRKVFPSLISHFQNESKGMFKADICRGSALYETGGIYLDADVGVRHDLWSQLASSTEFVTARVHRQSKWPGHFFQAILGAAPKSPIIYEYLQLFHDYYTGKEQVPSKAPLGVVLLKRAWDKVYNTTTQLPATELWQEILYHAAIFPNLVPVPTWGTRRACHFVVVSKAHTNATAEMWDAKGNMFSIPAYSRIGGSRMCPLGNTIDDEAKHDNGKTKE